MRKCRFLFVFFATISVVSAQTGGNGVFSILNIPMHSKALAWSGYLLAQSSADVLQTTNNPAMLNSSHKRNVGLGVGTILPGVLTANFCFGFTVGDTLRNKKQNKALSIPIFQGFAQHIDYGTMDAYDAGGNPTGKVSANETNIGIGMSMDINEHWRWGSQLGIVYSVLGPYIGNGVYLNLGAHYVSVDSGLSFGVVCKNMGTQIIAYHGVGREALPFTIQAAIAFKPKHMPFRFHITAHSLQRWDLTYNQYLTMPGEIDLNGKQMVAKKAGFTEKLARHFALGTELALGQNMGLLFGYNLQRRKEMSTADHRGTSGFGWGIKFRMVKCDITYSSAAYFTNQNSNMVSIVFNPFQFRQKL